MDFGRNTAAREPTALRAGHLYAGARAANAYSLGHDRHSFGGVLE